MEIVILGNFVGNFIEKIKKEKNIQTWNVSTILYHADKMNKEKTLSENNIKDNDSILLYLNGPTITMTENTTSSSGQNTSKLLNENKNTPKKILISHFNSKKHNHGMVFLFSNNK